MMIPTPEINKASVAVYGMTCEHCADSVTKGLQQLEGIDPSSVSVDLEGKKVTFSCTDKAITKETISKAIEDLGYDSGTPQFNDSPHSSSLNLAHARVGISGMTCSHCVNSVTKALTSLNSVDKNSIVVQLDTMGADFSYVPGSLSEDMIRDVIDSAGYGVETVKLDTSISMPTEFASLVDRLNINVAGMTCDHCANTIQQGLHKLNGVHSDSISIDAASGKVTLLVTSGEEIVDAITNKIDELGYEVLNFEKELFSQQASTICTAHISILGMTCSHCSTSVHNALSSHPGIFSDTIEVNLDQEEANLVYDSTKISQEALRDIIEDLGYDVEKVTSSPATKAPALDARSIADVKLRKAVFRVLGMTCDSCVGAVTEILKSLPGAQAESIHVGLHTEMGMVVFDGDDITPELITRRLDDAGYEASNVQIIHNLLPPKVMDEIEEFIDEDNKSIISLQRVITHNSDKSLASISIYSSSNESLQTVSMQISGMTCASCVGTIEKNIKTWRGVTPESVKVNLLTTSAVFTMEKNALTNKDIQKMVKKLGYKASDINVTKGTASTVVPAKFEVRMIVTGMFCNKCETKVKLALQELPGIIPNSISVSFDTGKVRFQLNKNATTQRQIQRVVQKLGFAAESIDIIKKMDRDEMVNSSKVDDNLVNTRLIVTGMTCSSCVSNIEKTLLRHDGITKAQVNLLAKSAFICHDPNKVGSRELVNLIEQIGYKAELAPEEDKSNQSDAMKTRMKKEEKVLRTRFLWSLLFAIPVLLISMIFMMALSPSNPVRHNLSKTVAPNLTIANLVLFILSTPVQFILGSSFYVKAYRSLRYSHTANMETLVALGTSVAYFASVGTVAAAMAKPDSMLEPMNYFETSVFLITFIHLGKWLEALAKGKTAETITKLMDLQPEKAILITVSYNEKDKTLGKQEVLQESEIDTKDIQVGDILKVRAGDRIPCDGKIWRGASTLDESMITGESIPVAKEISSDVITATINMTSEIYIRAVRVGSNTTLSRIIQLVQDAQASPKAPIEVMADKISSVFVPVVILLAVITFIIWEVLGIYEKYPMYWIPMGETKEIFSLMFAVSVLVIACPCGLGLASPTAVMVGTGVAARHGVLVKGGGYALEMANRISAIAFDKTGTLTTGKPTVRDNWVLTEKDNKNNHAQILMAWKIFGRVAGASNHPLSMAIYQKAKEFFSSSDIKVEKSTSGSVEGYESHLEDDENTKYVDVFQGVDLIQSKETPGRGITATIIVRQDNHLLSSMTGAPSNIYNIYLGNEEWMKENMAKHASKEMSITRRKELQQWQNEGMSIVMFAICPVQSSEQSSPSENTGSGCQDECSCVICNCASHGTCETSRTIVLAQIAIADQARPEAKSVIESLRRNGIEVWMITGDNPTTGKAVARQIGIDEDCVLAGVKPEQKADKIKNLQRRNSSIDRKKSKNPLHKSKKSRGVVAMIGDGINDSPALAQADVGISVGSATDIAIEAASIVLIRNNLLDLLTMYDLSKTVVRRIRINFLWAFVYNVVAIPIAAGVIFPASGQGLPPYLAGLAMVISSVSVVCSSLMLRLYGAPTVQTHHK